MEEVRFSTRRSYLHASCPRKKIQERMDNKRMFEQVKDVRRNVVRISNQKAVGKHGKSENKQE